MKDILVETTLWNPITYVEEKHGEHQMRKKKVSTRLSFETFLRKLSELPETKTNIQ